MILAVDPGLSGALARYDGQHLSILDMPTYVAKAGKRQVDRRFLDEPELVRLVQMCGMECDWLIMEQVGGIPAQSASSAFTFGRGVGVIIGAAIGIGIRREEVHPATWKSALRVPADKRAARVRASELLPAYSGLWAIVRNECDQEQASGRAEAAMIALWGWQVFGPQK